MFRTDQNRNPSAFTTEIAIQAGLVRDIDFIDGTPFPAPSKLITAYLLGDPVATTIRVIDALGYKTHAGTPRWLYIDMPKFVWNALDADGKRDVVGYHYQYEGGTSMRGLFPNYGKP